MIAGTAFVSVVLFVAAFSALGVTRVATNALATVRGALSVFSDRGLDDDARERAARRASIQLFASSLSLAGRGAAACLLSLLPIALADRAGVAAGPDVVSFLLGWNVLAIVTALMVATYLVKRTGWPST